MSWGGGESPIKRFSHLILWYGYVTRLDLWTTCTYSAGLILLALRIPCGGEFPLSRLTHLIFCLYYSADVILFALHIPCGGRVSPIKVHASDPSPLVLLCRPHPPCLQYLIRGRVLSIAHCLLPLVSAFFAASNILSSTLSYTTALFPRFSYEVLGVLPRLVKGLNAILSGENINILLLEVYYCITFVQVFIIYVGGEDHW